MNKNLRIFTFIFTLIFFFSSTVGPTLAAISYTYDANGNMTSNGTNCYEYNDANQLKKVKKCSNNETIAEYVYDYKGNRMVKKSYTGGSLQKTVFSPNDETERVKLASNGATQDTSYYYANDQLIAKKDPSGVRTYYQNDHLGSASLMTNQGGALVENTTYDPWGEIKTGGTKSKFLYTGQENDSESSLHYYNARYYDPHIRRFTQPDDIVEDVYNPQMLNRYSYVGNNPLRYTDPSGNCWGPWAAVCGSIAYIASRTVNTVAKLVSGQSARNVVTTVTNAAKSAVSNIANTVRSAASNVSNPAKSNNVVKSGGSNSGNNISQQSKNVPNPYGRGGGPAHQSTINNNIKNFESQGQRLIKTEFQVDTPGGYKATRFADFAMQSPEGKTTFYQVGRQTKSGLPVARERRALEDITNALINKYGDLEKFDVQFIPYN